MNEVTIIGKGPSLIDCKFDTELWATLTILELPEYRDKNYSKLFAFDSTKIPAIQKCLEIAHEKKIPIISTKGYADEPYPYQEIRDFLSIHFFRNTITYMLAYAIYLKYEKIKVYGVDQAPEWDYICNRPYTLFWLGVAAGKGIEIELARSSLLRKEMSEVIKKKIAEITQKRNWDEMGVIADSPVFVRGDGASVEMITKEGKHYTMKPMDKEQIEEFKLRHKGG